MATLMLVDLAGSEHLDKTGAKGRQFQEAVSINVSLLMLQNLISAWARNPNGHIPYEEHALTRVLRPCLSAHSRIALLITLRSEEQYQAESKRSLEFAQTAMSITCKPVSNKLEGRRHFSRMDSDCKVCVSCLIATGMSTS